VCGLLRGMVAGEATGESRRYSANLATGCQVRRRVLNHIDPTNLLYAQFFRGRRQRRPKAIGDKSLDADRAEGRCQIIMRAACPVRAESHNGTGNQVSHLQLH